MTAQIAVSALLVFAMSWALINGARAVAKGGGRMSELKTVKRHAEIGEKILITDALMSLGKYKDGDIMTVTENAFGDSSGWVHTSKSRIGIAPKEYEVILEEKGDDKMAKLDVKVIGMENGKITEVEFSGDKYVKTKKRPAVGGLALSKVNGGGVTKGAFYPIIGVYSDGDVRIEDDVNDGHDRCADYLEFFRKVSEPSTEERLGSLETRVDALEQGEQMTGQTFEKPAQEGDTIRIVDAHWVCAGDDYDNGDVMTVTSVSGGKVEATNKYDGIIVDDEFEIIGRKGEGNDADPRSKFAKGDRVRLLSGGGEYPLAGYNDGEIYEVFDPKWDGHCGNRISIDRPGGSMGYALPSEIEKVSQEPLEVGDYVKVIGLTRYSDFSEGTFAKVDRGIDDDGEHRIVSTGGDYDYDYAKPSALEKVEPSERELSFLRAGRKIDEVKKGDIVRTTVGQYGHPFGTIGVSVGEDKVEARGKVYYHSDLVLVAANDDRVDVSAE